MNVFTQLFLKGINLNISFLLGDVTAKGGIEKVTLTLSVALNNNQNVNIISLYKTHSESVFDHKGVPVNFLKGHFETSMYNRPYKSILGYFFDLVYILKKNFSLNKALTKSKAEIVVTCDIKMTILAWCSSLFTKRKIIAIEHFEYEVAHPILRKVRKILYRKIAALVTLTAEDYEKYHWMEKHKLHTIPNIVKVKPSTSSQNKKKDVIAVGRMTNQKGFDLLIKAWSKIYKTHSDWTLKIFGDGEDREKLQAQIDTYSIKNIKLEYFVNDIDSVYQQSEVFVLSSRYEGLGMVLIEALAHQLACISFDCPAGPKTIIQNDKNGLLVPTGDVDRLAEAMDNLLGSKTLRDKYSQNALSSIEVYSEKSVINKWNKLLAELDDE